ncbi:hypothetical protein Q8F55_000128 [Vanrija albida]|uniref:Uncharacterized protein n=1 Tax=Vanrija albida TaxID=181172 RepID=A0ABR3QDB8_9TREE
MSLPAHIGEASQLDPLVLLPLPAKLPPSPLPQLHDLSAQLTAHLGNGPAPDLPVLTAQMKSTTRASQTLLNAARSGAADARAGLDEADVALRTVMYELDRVREEMAQCMSYEPMYESLDIPDEEAFLACADTEVLATLPADGEPRARALIISRLEAELAAIMEREATVAALTAERDGLLRSRRELKSKYDKVDVYLADYARTSSAMAAKVKEVAHVASPAAPKDKDEPAAASPTPAQA